VKRGFGLIILVPVLVMIAPTGVAQPPPPVTTLEGAFLKRVADDEVSAARVELAAAELAAARVTADPFALRLPRVQAEHALTDARAALDSAHFAAQLETQDAYFEALEAADAVRLAERERDLAQTTLGATEIRFEAGAAMAVDVDRARNEVGAATRILDAERTRQLLAAGQLAARLGIGIDTLVLQELTVNTVVPTLDDVLERSKNNHELRVAVQALEEARIYLEGVDNAFSARAELEGAQAAFQAARTGLAELRRSVALSVRSAHLTALAFGDALRAAEEGYTTERAALEVQRARFDAGSISQLELAQAKLDAATSAAQVKRARHELARSVAALEGVVRGTGGAPPSLPDIGVDEESGEE